MRYVKGSVHAYVLGVGERFSPSHSFFFSQLVEPFRTGAGDDNDKGGKEEEVCVLQLRYRRVYVVLLYSTLSRDNGRTRG